ncbi:MAG: 30S ribosomal protein S20 [Desulfococcaceae bacterium]
MANHKSALKRARQNVVRRERNRANKTRVKTAVKKVRTDAATGAMDAIPGDLQAAQSILDKAAKKGAIHRRTAARKVARLMRLANRAAQA